MVEPLNGPWGQAPSRSGIATATAMKPRMRNLPGIALAVLMAEGAEKFPCGGFLKARVRSDAARRYRRMAVAPAAPPAPATRRSTGPASAAEDARRFRGRACDGWRLRTHRSPRR